VRGTPCEWYDRIYTLFPRLRERHAQYAGTLSGGEQQMLAIGRALMGNPRYFCSTSRRKPCAPDRRRSRSHHQTMKEEGQSIVLVEQNIQLALDVADQAVILNTGRCVFAGNASDIMNMKS